MAKRRRTISAVVDTNVFVGNFLARRRRSPNRRVIRLWMIERRFKLALSSQIEAEYLRIFEELLDFDRDTLARWERRFANKRITRTVGVGTSSLSRDPKDNVFIATAQAAKSKFLITNDRDLRYQRGKKAHTQVRNCYPSAILGATGESWLIR